MPVKDKSKYPANWAEISKAQRERAGNKCELCGAVNHQPHPVTGSKVVLTVHHIEWLDDPALNNSYPNLIALCQRCHNRLDLGKRQRNAAATRKTKKYCANCEHLSYVGYAPICEHPNRRTKWDTPMPIGCMWFPCQEFKPKSGKDGRDERGV